MRKESFNKRRSLPPLIAATVLLMGCSSLFSGGRHQIELANDAYVTTPHGKTVMHKKGEKIVVSAGESVFIESPGYIGLLVLNDGGDSSTNKVDLKPADEWLGPVYQRKLNRSLNELITNMNEAQVLLSSRKAAEALSKVLRLEKKFPDLVELELLEASCHVVLGDRSKAVTVLADALKEDPSNESAQSFYRSLVGDEAANRLPAANTSPRGNPGRPR